MRASNPLNPDAGGRRRAWWILGCLLALIVGPATGTLRGTGLETPEALFQQANELFAAGLAAHDAEPGAGQAEFLTAAVRYGELVAEHGIENHTLHANRGAALLLGGDVGRALAAFRRAERIDPTDPAVREGLSAARARVRTSIAPAAESRAREVLLGWRGRVEREMLLGVAVAAYSIAWLAAAARVLGARRAMPVVFAAGAVAAVAAAPLAVEAALHEPGEAVVITEVVGLNGPSHGAYAPTFATPLTAGVECRVVERRGAWMRIRLADASETWVAADAVEEI